MRVTRGPPDFGDMILGQADSGLNPVAVAPRFVKGDRPVHFVPVRRLPAEIFGA
jgi:hypothetical protein